MTAEILVLVFDALSAVTDRRHILRLHFHALVSLPTRGNREVFRAEIG
jgi:hypothetical protein